MRRQWEEKKTPGAPKTATRIFLTSLSASAKDKKRSTAAARGHWSVENRNHYKRDASLWREDGHHHRRPRAALNLALTRNALLAIIPFEEGQPLADFFELHHRHPAKALHLILHSRPVL